MASLLAEEVVLLAEQTIGSDSVAGAELVVGSGPGRGAYQEARNRVEAPDRRRILVVSAKTGDCHSMASI